MAPLALSPVLLMGQGAGVAPADLLKPLKDSWPTYNGDYTGRRYSGLAQINQSNVKNLTLAWTVRLNAGPNGAGAGVTAPYTPRAPRTIVGGVGTNDYVGGTSVKGSILAVDNVLYVTAPDNVWALDASDGHLLWQYFWRTKGGTHIGNRGAAIWRNYLFFVTPDCYFVSLDARTGEERWPNRARGCECAAPSCLAAA